MDNWLIYQEDNRNSPDVDTHTITVFSCLSQSRVFFIYKNKLLWLFLGCCVFTVNFRPNTLMTSLFLGFPISVRTLLSSFGIDGSWSCLIYCHGVILQRKFSISQLEPLLLFQTVNSYQRIVISDTPIFVDGHKFFFFTGVRRPFWNTVPHLHSVWCWLSYELCQCKEPFF